MILINIKMQIRPEKMDQWLALADPYAEDVNSEDRLPVLPVPRPQPHQRHRVHLHRGLHQHPRRRARPAALRDEFLRHRTGPGGHPAADHLIDTPHRLRPDGRDPAPLTGSPRAAVTHTKIRSGYEPAVVILPQRRPGPAVAGLRTTPGRSPLPMQDRADDPLIGIMPDGGVMI